MAGKRGLPRCTATTNERPTLPALQEGLVDQACSVSRHFMAEEVRAQDELMRATTNIQRRLAKVEHDRSIRSTG
jgi:hypothetical protein